MLDIVVPTEDNFRISPKSVCALYLMLKLHFNGKYDVIKYNWKYGISDASFNARNDKRFFESIAYKYRIHELVRIFVNSLLSNNEGWIGGMTSSASIAEYRKYETLLMSYAREFKKETEILSLFCKRNGYKFSDLIKYNDTKKSSLIFKLLLNGSVKFETFIILDRIFNIIENYDKSFDKDDFEWNEYSVILKAYRKLLIIDDVMYVNVLSDVLKDKLNLNVNREKLIELSKINGEKICQY